MGLTNSKTSQGATNRHLNFMSPGALVGVGALAVATIGAGWGIFGNGGPKAAFGMGRLESGNVSKSTGAYPPSWVQNLRFPEERDFLADAGLSQYKKYADYIKPNVGVPESKLGMTMLQFREIEKEIAKRVLSRNPKEVVDQIKKDKYGVVATNGATAAPEGMGRSEFMQWFNSQPENVKSDGMAEVNNQKKIPASINKDIADSILTITDEVLKEKGIDPKSNPLLRGMAFIRGAYYFTAEGVQYEDIERSLGPGAVKGMGMYTKGAFILDRPRGVCNEQTISLILVINSKSADLGINAMYYINETPTSRGNQQPSYYFNHACVVVKHLSNGYLEGIDVTKKTTLDSQDSDSRALWATGYSGVYKKLSEVSSTGGNMVANGDPLSELDLGGFKSIPPTVNDSIRDAVRR